jgi:uncharacterized membrane-anchored protein YhcB (DUF1043 family)
MNNTWVTWVIQSAIMVGVGTIGFFLKDMNTKTQKRLDANEEQTKDLEQRFNDFRADLPTKYVIRDDFIRAMSNVDTKLDKIYDIITNTKKGGE